MLLNCQEHLRFCSLRNISKHCKFTRDGEYVSDHDWCMVHALQAEYLFYSVIRENDCNYLTGEGVCCGAPWLTGGRHAVLTLAGGVGSGAIHCQPIGGTAVLLRVTFTWHPAVAMETGILIASQLIFPPSGIITETNPAI